MKKDRNTNLDLLRIVCMMMVVGQHFFGHGGLVEGNLVPWSVNWYLGNLIFVWFKVAVDCFVLLSGYFQCTSRFKLKRMSSVWLQASVYSLGLYLILAVVNDTFSVSRLITSAMTITGKAYWFVTAYFLMYAVSPILNCLIGAMTKRVHLLCCAVLLGIFSVAHNLVYTNDFGDVVGGSSFLWFCILYLVAAYIRLYVPVEKTHCKIGFAVFFISTSMIAAERFLAYWVTPMIFGSVRMESFFYANNSILVTVGSIALLMAMRAVQIRKPWLQRFIGFFAPLSFGVYLIHDHHAVRTVLWGMLNPAGFAQSPWMVLYLLTCVTGIFAVCCLLEWCRQKLFQLCGIDRVAAKISDKVQLKAERWLQGDAGNP